MTAVNRQNASYLQRIRIVDVRSRKRPGIGEGSAGDSVTGSDLRQAPGQEPLGQHLEAAISEEDRQAGGMERTLAMEDTEGRQGELGKPKAGTKGQLRRMKCKATGTGKADELSTACLAAWLPEARSLRTRRPSPRHAGKGKNHLSTLSAHPPAFSVPRRATVPITMPNFGWHLDSVTATL